MIVRAKQAAGSQRGTVDHTPLPHPSLSPLPSLPDLSSPNLTPLSIPLPRPGPPSHPRHRLPEPQARERAHRQRRPGQAVRHEVRQAAALPGRGGQAAQQNLHHVRDRGLSGARYGCHRQSLILIHLPLSPQPTSLIFVTVTTFAHATTLAPNFLPTMPPSPNHLTPLHPQRWCSSPATASPWTAGPWAPSCASCSPASRPSKAPPRPRDSPGTANGSCTEPRMVRKEEKRDRRGDR